MKSEKPQLKSKIRNLRDFFYKHYLAVAISVVLLWWLINWLRNYYSFIDFTAVYALVFLIVILVLLIIKLPSDRRKLGMGELLTTLSIFVAIFFFIYQDAANRRDKDVMISGVNFYNCSVACEIVTSFNQLEDKGSKFSMAYFERGFYLENLNFIAWRYKNEKVNFLSAVASMGAANRLLDLILNMNAGVDLPQVFSIWRNQQVADLSGQIAKRIGCICQN